MSSAAIGLAVCVIGAAIAVIGTFLPMADSATSLHIRDNSLIQNGQAGTIVVAAALGSVLVAFSSYQRGRRNVLPVLLGLGIIAVAIYAATSGLDLRLENPFGDPSGADVSSASAQQLRDAIALAKPIHGTPGVGIWATGIGGGILACGGLLLAGMRLSRN